MIKKSISAFFPAYNEAANLPSLILDANASLCDCFERYEIIIINDGSTDNSLSVLKKLKYANPHLRIISHQTNLGYGITIKDGFMAATGELVFFSDADRQFNLKEIKLLADKLNEFDVVIGYRKNRSDNIIRIINAWAWNKLIQIVFGVKFRDIDCAFKLFKREILKKINVETLISTGAMISTEVLVKLEKRGAKIKEIPVSHHPRKSGRATGAKPKVILRAFIELYKLWSTLPTIPTNKNC